MVKPQSYLNQSSINASHKIQLGPIIRAEVGNMIEVLLKNRIQTHYTSMHSMRLTYGKLYDGSDYLNTTTSTTPPFFHQEAFAPGSCVIYKWLVSSFDGPPHNEPSVLRSYHPFVNTMSDMNPGLVGPTIIYQRGQMHAATISSYRDFFFCFEVFDESSSWVNQPPSTLTDPSCSNRNASFYIP